MAWCGRQGFSLAPEDHDDVIKWKHFPRYGPFVRGIHRSPVNPPHKGQWRGALMFSSICAWINGWGNNHEAGDLRRYRTHHYEVIVMYLAFCLIQVMWQSYITGLFFAAHSVYLNVQMWLLLFRRTHGINGKIKINESDLQCKCAQVLTCFRYDSFEISWQLISGGQFW